MAAGSVVDQLAEEYQDQPVVFLEQGTSPLFGDRVSRFWAAHGYGTAYLPLIIADSGHQFSEGYRSDTMAAEFRAMVDTELTRPPQAEITAVQTREGEHLTFRVTVKNTSGVTLSSSNGAAVHVIVYEDIHAGVTNRYVRAAPYVSIQTPLADGETATFSLTTPDLSGVNWDRLHAVALVDYRPGGSTGAYDMLQASMAIAASFSVHPSSLAFLIDQSNPVSQHATVHFSGAPSTLQWSITENLPWLTASPLAGKVGEAAVVQVDAAALTPGVHQSGVITVIPDPLFSDAPIEIPVLAYLGDISKIYLPLIAR